MKSARWTRDKPVAVAFLLGATIALGSLSQADAQTTIKVGIISPTFGHAPFYIAREKGFYKAEGLIGEVIVMNRDDLILQSLVSDSIQFGNISPSAVFPARDQGLTDVKIIAGSFNGTTYSIIANAKFKTLESLKGAKIAVSSLQAGSTQVLKYILKQRGLIYPRDYNLIRAGGTTLRWAALQTQQVDGAILAEPVSLIAVNNGFVNLGDADKLVPGYQLAGVWIREGWAAKNKEVTLRFLRAFHNALIWLHDNRAEALQILPKITTLPKQYVQSAWETYTKAIWPRDGKANRKGLQLVIDLMAEDGLLKKPVKPEDVIDDSYLQEIGADIGAK
jgi:ABC-type nitrate/sulfonate/bicarbonate transport system substrate-binding protein